jgi:hypothetical protein
MVYPSVGADGSMREHAMKAKTTLPMLIAAILLAGCADTTRDRDVQYSGFLGDYSLLVRGAEKQAERRYVRPDVDWASYSRVLLDPVMLWRGDASRRDGASGHDAQAMMDYFYALIYRDLKALGLEMVTAPKPDTLRVQVALTKLDESHVVLDVVSTVLPATLALSGLDKLVTGKPAFVGEAEIEYKVTDAETGELLAAGVDHRVGGKLLKASHLSSWGEVQHIMQLWAAYGSYNLCKLQRRSTCVEPKS